MRRTAIGNRQSKIQNPKSAFRLSSGELRLVRSLCDRKAGSQKELAARLRLSPAVVSRIVASLRRKGFTEEGGGGVRLSDTHHARCLHEYMLERSEVKVEEVLARSAMDVLLLLAYRPATTRDLLLHSGRSPATLQRTLSLLCRHGLIVRVGRIYRANSRHERCFGFIRAYRHHLNRLRIASCSRALILWEEGREFLFRTVDFLTDHAFIPTGHRALARHGVRLFSTAHRAYFVPLRPRRLAFEEVLLHMLREDPFSTRNILYALIALEKNRANWRRLEGEAVRYRLGELAAALHRYLDGRGRDAPEIFPTWREFRRKVEEYG